MYVNDETPSGAVFMRFNSKTDGFEYWSNDKFIRYDYLETVARKYVKMFDARHLYVDRKKNVERQIKKMRKELAEKNKKNENENENENENKNEKNKETNDDDLFVKFKTPAEKNRQKFKTKMLVQTKRRGESLSEEEINEKTIIPTEANKFIYKGRITEMDLFKPTKKAQTTKNISFGLFKSMFGSTSPMS